MLALLVAGLRGDDRLRAYLATTLALCFWFPLEVGIFASQHVGYLAERNLLPLAPVLFVGFAAWLARGGPRPLLPLAAAIAGSLVLLLVLPVNRVVRPEAFPDSFTLLPLIRLEKHSPGTDLDLLVLGIAAAALATVTMRGRGAPRASQTAKPTNSTGASGSMFRSAR